MGSSNEDILVQLTRTEELAKSNRHRIDDVEDELKEVRKDYALMYEMNKNMAVIAEQTKNTCEDIKEIKTDVDVLKRTKSGADSTEKVIEEVEAMKNIPNQLLYKAVEYGVVLIVSYLFSQVFTK